MTQEHFVNAAMEWGIEQEPMAAAAYEARKGVMVEECGFFNHPTVLKSGATPDRLVGTDGVLEIKNPTTGTHIDTILGAEIDFDYLCQMAYEVDCTGRKWADFVSYDSRLPGNLVYFCKRYTPPMEFIESIRAEVIKFNAELDALEARVRAYDPNKVEDVPVTEAEMIADELDIF
jgi:predicted phage-related endonuclease